MNSKGLPTAAHTLFVNVFSQSLLTVILLFIALLYPPIASAKLDDLPSDCKNFHFRDISGMPITSSDKTGYFFKISQPEDRRKSKGMGDVFFRLLQDTEVDYIHPASSILLTAPELSFHIVGEGQYCRINLGKRWLEYEGVYSLLDDAAYKQFHRMFTIRQTQNSGQPAEANAYAAVEPYIREMLAKKLPQTVQDWAAEQEEHQKELQQEAQTDRPNQQADGATLDLIFLSNTDSAETQPTSTELRQDSSLKSSSTGAEHAPQNVDAGSVQADRIYQLPTQEVRSEPINTWNAPDIGWIFQTLAISLMVMFAAVVFILWKIVRQS